MRIRTGGYKPQSVRMVEIPKEDGSTRPLAISCFEDKLVQHAVTEFGRFAQRHAKERNRKTETIWSSYTY